MIAGAAVDRERVRRGSRSVAELVGERDRAAVGPATVGVPEMIPVIASTVIPGGRPDTDQL